MAVGFLDIEDAFCLTGGFYFQHDISCISVLQ